MSRIRSLAENLRGAAARVRDEEPPLADEKAALRDILAALPRDLAEEDGSRLLGDLSGARRRRFVGGLSAAAAVVLVALCVWYAVAHLGPTGEPVQVAREGPALRVDLTPPPLQALVLRPAAPTEAPKETGPSENEVVDIGPYPAGELHITAEEDCVVFVTLLGTGPGVIHPRPEGRRDERAVRKGQREYFHFVLPEDKYSGVFLILASRERRDLAEVVRSVTESLDPQDMEEEDSIDLIVQRLREHPDLSVRTARFRRTRKEGR